MVPEYTPREPTRPTPPAPSREEGLVRAPTGSGPTTAARELPTSLGDTAREHRGAREDSGPACRADELGAREAVDPPPTGTGLPATVPAEDRTGDQLPKGSPGHPAKTGTASKAEAKEAHKEAHKVDHKGDGKSGFQTVLKVDRVTGLQDHKVANPRDKSALVALEAAKEDNKVANKFG